MSSAPAAAADGARGSRRWVVPVTAGVALVGGVLVGLALGLLVDNPRGTPEADQAAELACQLNERWGGREAAEALERDGISGEFSGGTDVTRLQTIANAAMVAGNEDDRYQAFGEAGQAMISAVVRLDFDGLTGGIDQLERACGELGL